MIKFSKEKVLLLHQLITAETGGDPNIRDVNLRVNFMSSLSSNHLLIFADKTPLGLQLCFLYMYNHYRLTFYTQHKSSISAHIFCLFLLHTGS